MEKIKLSAKKSFSLADPQNSHLHIRNILICISAIFSFAYPQFFKFFSLRPAEKPNPPINISQVRCHVSHKSDIMYLTSQISCISQVRYHVSHKSGIMYLISQVSCI